MSNQTGPVVVESTPNTIHLPDILALNTTLELSEGDALSTRGSEWVTLTQSKRGHRALIVGQCNVVAASLLAARFDDVEYWHLNSEAAMSPVDQAAILDVQLRAVHVSVDDLAKRLQQRKNHFDLIAIDDCLTEITDGSAENLEVFSGLLKEALTPVGQYCVVTNIRPSFAGMPVRRRKSGHFTLGKLQKTLPTTAHARTYYCYPDHRRPYEFLGWSGAVPSKRRSVFTRVLDLAGLVTPLHNSVVAIGRASSELSCLQSIVDRAFEQAGYQGQALIQHCFPRYNGTVIVMLDSDIKSESAGVLRIPLSCSAEHRLQHAWFGLEKLTVKLPWLENITPRALASGEHCGMKYYFERSCTGTPADELLKKKPFRVRLDEALLDITLKFAGYDADTSGSAPKAADEAAVLQCITLCFEPVRAFAPDYQAQLDRLFGHLCRRLVGSGIPLIPVHGDLNATNVLCDHESGEIKGLIDWDACQTEGLPMQDFAHFIVHRYRTEKSMSMGDAIIAALSGELFDEREKGLIWRYRETLKIDDDLVDSLLVMYWLRHVSLHINYRHGPLPQSWLQSNLYLPIDYLASLIS